MKKGKCLKGKRTSKKERMQRRGKRKALLKGADAGSDDIGRRERGGVLKDFIGETNGNLEGSPGRRGKVHSEAMSTALGRRRCRGRV